jgi:hypothetical protein
MGALFLGAAAVLFNSTKGASTMHVHLVLPRPNREHPLAAGFEARRRDQRLLLLKAQRRRRRRLLLWALR